MSDKRESQGAGYLYRDAELNHSHAYLLPVVFRVLESLDLEGPRRRVFELGCGNGSVAHELSKRGYAVTGIDPSQHGIAQAKERYPGIRLEEGSAYDDLAAKYGRFPAVTSLEVVEHVFHPRKYASTLYDLLEPGGTAVLSTPYHGYLKNLVLAVTGKLDDHFTALWDYGHIKFWSIRTLGTLLAEAGFVRVEFVKAGRVPPLAKSMIAVARKPK